MCARVSENRDTRRETERESESESERREKKKEGARKEKREKYADYDVVVSIYDADDAARNFFLKTCVLYLFASSRECAVESLNL